MGSFITKSYTKVVRNEAWEPWEQATIRRWTIKNKDTMNAEIIKIAGVAGQIPEVVIQAATIPVLISAIASWTFTKNGEEDGDLAPVNRHWIGLLDPAYADFIAAEIYTFNGGATEEEREQFFRGTEDSDADGREAAA